MINIQWTKFERKSIALLFQRNYLKDTILILVSFLLFTVFLKRENIDLIRENLSLKKRVTRKENYLKITFFKKKEITNKLRGAKCATTKLKNQLKEKIKVVNTKCSLEDTCPWEELSKPENCNVYGLHSILTGCMSFI